MAGDDTTGPLLAVDRETALLSVVGSEPGDLFETNCREVTLAGRAKAFSSR